MAEEDISANAADTSAPGAEAAGGETQLTDQQADDATDAAMLEAAAERGTSSSPEPTAKPAAAKEKPSAKTAESKAEGEPRTAEPTPEDKLLADAQAEVDAEREKQERASVKAAADRLAADEAERARLASAKAGEPTPVDIPKTIEGLLKDAGDTPIEDVDENGRPKKSTLKEWAETYPGIMQAVAVVVAKLSPHQGNAAASLAERIAAIESAEEQRSWNAERAKVFSVLATEEFGGHADAQQIVDDPKYAAAVEAAPDAIKTCANSFDPKRQKIALEWYKAKAGIKSATVKKVEAQRKRDGIPAKAGLRNAGGPAQKPDGDEVDAKEADDLLESGMKATMTGGHL